jgi:alpha-L-arabinofuranosidase
MKIPQKRLLVPVTVALLAVMGLTAGWFLLRLDAAQVDARVEQARQAVEAIAHSPSSVFAPSRRLPSGHDHPYNLSYQCLAAQPVTINRNAPRFKHLKENHSHLPRRDDGSLHCRGPNLTFTLRNVKQPEP